MGIHRTIFIMMEKIGKIVKKYDVLGVIDSVSNEFIQLHPDDINHLLENESTFLSLQIKIINKNVKYKTILHLKMGGSIIYAKIISFIDKDTEEIYNLLD